MYKESTYNKTERGSTRQGQDMLNTFYQYYQAPGEVNQLDLSDKQKTYSVGRYINKDAQAFYSNMLSKKGSSNIAFT
jgi:hypothetical protein